MKRSRFSDEQIIGIVKEQEAGMGTAEVCRRARDQLGDALQMEGQVRRSGGIGGQAAAVVGG